MTRGLILAAALFGAVPLLGLAAALTLRWLIATEQPGPADDPQAVFLDPVDAHARTAPIPVPDLSPWLPADDDPRDKLPPWMSELLVEETEQFLKEHVQ